ncbi:MAG: hypothetical protein Alis3KO_05320 [Aliiglaciecola sp.]
MTRSYASMFLLAFICLSGWSATAEEQGEYIHINCNNAKQMQCFGSELKSIRANAQVCSKDQSKASYNLTLLSQQKYPDSESSSPNAIEALRNGWVEALQNQCMDELPFDPKKESSWVNQFMLGYALQSDYNEEGKHEGLDRKHAIAKFGFEGRWLTHSSHAIHWEIGGLFAGTPVNTEDSETENPDPEMHQVSRPIAVGMMDEEPSEGESDKDTVKFTDVSDSLDIFTKLTFSPVSYKNKIMKDYFTVGGLVGFKTRDSVTDQQDSVIYYGGLLAEYLYYGQDMSNVKNQIPRGKVWLAYLNFEEYGGVSHVNRLVLTGEWQLNAEADSEKGRFVVGFKANVGKGADDVGIFFGYRSGFGAIKDFLTGP